METLLQLMDRELKDLDASAPVGTQLSSLAGNIVVDTSGGKMSFCISDGNGKLLYSNSSLTGRPSIYRQISSVSRGYEIYTDSGQYYIHMIRAASIQEQTYYLENFREITYLFESRKSQYTSFALLMCILSVAVGLATFLVCSMLLSPLKRLSAATRQMAGGRFRQHLSISSEIHIRPVNARSLGITLPDEEAAISDDTTMMENRGTFDTND